MGSNLFIVNVSNLERLEAQSIPDEISWPRTVKDAEISVVGRNNPLNQYITGTDTISFSLSFFAEEENSSDVLKKIRWLRSLMYNDGGRSARPSVRLVFGDIFKDEVWILTGFNPKMGLLDKTNAMLPQIARVDLTFKFDPRKNLTRRDVL